MAVNDVVELQQRVEDGWELIHSTPAISERVRQSFMRRAAHFVEAQGWHFDHFL
jgi:hypothetical protein